MVIETQEWQIWTLELENGECPFDDWLRDLAKVTQARIIIDTYIAINNTL